MTRTLILMATIGTPFLTGCDTTTTAHPVPLPATMNSATTIRRDEAASLQTGKLLTMLGTIPENEDVSGIGVIGDHVFLVSDETAHVEVLKRSESGLTPTSRVQLGTGEMDLEAVAVDGTMVYVAGSHSRVRPKIKKKDDYATIRQKLIEIDTQPVRDIVARFRFEDGTAGPVETISLRTAIAASPELRTFADIPGKENGVDVEGLAVKDGKLYIGFRSPVLRANYLPIMVTTFENPTTTEIRFINLNGLGVRDLIATSDGFLILAGPPSDGPGESKLYHWDGGDSLPGATHPGRCRPLGELPSTEGKPEGITILSETDQEYELLLVCDGVKNGRPMVIRCRK